MCGYCGYGCCHHHSCHGGWAGSGPEYLRGLPPYYGPVPQRNSREFLEEERTLLERRLKNIEARLSELSS